VTVRETLGAGVVGINHLVPATAEAPFGGVKNSGFRCQNGLAGMDTYLVTTHINYLLLGAPDHATDR
jgi:succinate-semialdehyde dehydrogenase/glutarate-semialdehyde dehydrogenase